MYSIRGRFRYHEVAAVQGLFILVFLGHANCKDQSREETRFHSKGALKQIVQNVFREELRVVFT